MGLTYVEGVLTGPTGKTAHPEGHHIWLTLSPDWTRAEFVGYVRPRGVASVASEPFAINPAPPNAVRISLGAAGDQDELRQTFQLVTETLAPSPRRIIDGNLTWLPLGRRGAGAK